MLRHFTLHFFLFFTKIKSIQILLHDILHFILLFFRSHFRASLPSVFQCCLAGQALFASSCRCTENIDVFVDYDDVEMKVNEICNRTFLGDFVVGEVKIRENSSGNSFTEVWALKIPVNMKFSLKHYYNACAERCGYIY